MGAGRLTIKCLRSGLWSWRRDESDIAQASPVPAAVIVQAVRWRFRFLLSIKDVEELMAERGVEFSREAIRR